MLTIGARLSSIAFASEVFRTSFELTYKILADGATAPDHSTSSWASARSAERVPGSGPYSLVVGALVLSPDAARKAATSARPMSVWPTTPIVTPVPLLQFVHTGLIS